MKIKHCLKRAVSTTLAGVMLASTVSVDPSALAVDQADAGVPALPGEAPIAVHFKGNPGILAHGTDFPPLGGPVEIEGEPFSRPAGAETQGYNIEAILVLHGKSTHFTAVHQIHDGRVVGDSPVLSTHHFSSTS